jgi:DNA-binding transcriptional regulator YiaG
MSFSLGTSARFDGSIPGLSTQLTFAIRATLQIACLARIWIVRIFPPIHKEQQFVSEDELNFIIQHLRAARKNMGLTQHQVSKMMGRSPNFFTKFESGQRSIDVMGLLELALIYKTPVTDFFPS